MTKRLDQSNDRPAIDSDVWIGVLVAALVSLPIWVIIFYAFFS